jgi:two-component sensor histidine kinase
LRAKHVEAAARNVEFDPQVRLFHQAVLLHELNHRINNEFSSAISAVSLAAAHSGNEEVKMALSAVKICTRARRPCRCQELDIFSPHF